MEDYLQVANEFWIWVLAFIAVSWALLQALLYYKQLFKAVGTADITELQLRRAFRTGAITAIGPSIAIFIIMIGLMTVIGTPMAWMRLAVIGAAPTELTAAHLGADAVGVPFAGEGYDIYAMTVSWWTMTINGIGWLLLVGLFAHKLEALREKAAAGDINWLGVITVAAMIGVFGYLNATNIIALGGPLIAAISGMIAMPILLLIAKKYPPFKEYTLGVAMLIGMFVAVVAVG